MNYKSERHAALDHSWPSCSGPCGQGREKCPTPQACQQPEDLPMNRWDFVLGVFICSVCAGFVVVGPMVMDFLKVHLS